MIYFDKPYLQIAYDYTIRCAVSTWSGYFTDTEYEYALRKYAEVIDHTKATALILHVRQPTPAATAVYWNHLEWLAQVHVAEITKLAFVVPPPVLRLVWQPEAITYAAEHVALTRYFDSMNDARYWVREK